MRLRNSARPRWQQVPPGMPDLGPAEAAQRAVLLDLLRDEFRRWGYQEVATPTLEYLDTLTRGAGTGMADQLFKITDRGGELLALRPEFTVSVARLAASRLLPARAAPLRLAYVGPVFRGQEEGRGRLREFTQAGVELIGEPSLDGDAEVIALAASCLRRAGAGGAVLNIGHPGFIDEALAPLPPATREEVRTVLYRKAFVELEDLDIDPPLARLLRSLPELRGADALDRARPFAVSDRGRRALDTVGVLKDRLHEYGADDLVGIDLGIIRDFGYYTGIVFEAYASGTGYALVGGGRYDHLLERFGASAPATGFALGVDRLKATVPTHAARGAQILVTTPPSADALRAEAVTLAGVLRSRGRPVLMALGTGWAEAVRRAQVDGIEWVAALEDAGVRLLDRSTGREERVAVRNVAAAIAGDVVPESVWSH